MEKILKTDNLFTGKVLGIDKTTIDFGNNSKGEFEIMKFNESEGKGVMIIPIDADDKVIMVKQFQLGMEKRTLVLPRGGIEEGVEETIQVQKELQEEIGYKAKKITKLTEIEIFPGYVKASSSLYLAEDLEESNIEGDEIEDIEIHHIKLSKLLDLIKKGEIVDSRTIAGVLFYSQFYYN